MLIATVLHVILCIWGHSQSLFLCSTLSCYVSWSRDRDPLQRGILIYIYIYKLWELRRLINSLQLCESLKYLNDSVTYIYMFPVQWNLAICIKQKKSQVLVCMVSFQKIKKPKNLCLCDTASLRSRVWTLSNGKIFRRGCCSRNMDNGYRVRNFTKKNTCLHRVSTSN